MLSFLRAAHPPRTSSASHNPILYEDGTSSVTFRQPGSDFIMTHVIPGSAKVKGGASIVTPPFHYHIYQDEYFRVQSGTGNFYIGLDPAPAFVLRGSAATGASETASVTAGRYHRFENASEAEDLVVDVQLTPESYESEQRFFRNFFGYLNDCKQAGKPPAFFQLMVFLHAADTPLALPLPWEWAGRIASRVFLAGAALWGSWVLGYRSSYREYYEERKSR